MEKTRLGKADWMRAARLALLNGGPAAVRVETLARELKVTKGSFYWHFKDREDLLEALLREWEEEKSFLSEVSAKSTMRERLVFLFNGLRQRVVLSEKGEWPSDAAIFGWAAVAPKVAARAKKEEHERISLLSEITGDEDLAEYIYMAYLGFLLRRRRVPEAAKNFPILEHISSALVLSDPAGRKDSLHNRKIRRGLKK